MTNQPSMENSEDDKRDLVMSHKEARAGCPEDIAACGEKDNGAGLESLVTRDDYTVSLAPGFFKTKGFGGDFP